MKREKKRIAYFPKGAKHPIEYDPFPDSIGYESWLIFKAKQMGWHVKVVPEARYIHLRPYGSYSVWTNGQSMYVNGYPFFIMLLRVLKNLVFGEWALSKQEEAMQIQSLLDIPLVTPKGMLNLYDVVLPFCQMFRRFIMQFGMIGGFIQYAVRAEPKLDTAWFAYCYEVDRLRRFIKL